MINRTARNIGLLTLVAAVLVGGGLLLTGGRDSAPADPSYAGLRTVLKDGAGKDEIGDVEVFQFRRPDPAAWIKVFVNPQTGDVQIWKVKHATFEEGPGIPTSYVSIPPCPARTLEEFLDWIVDTYEHVGSKEELTPVALD